MKRLSEMRPDASAPEAPPSPQHASDEAHVIDGATVAKLMDAEKRLLRLVAPSEYRTFMTDVGFDLMTRRATVAEVLKRVDAELSRAEACMRVARAHLMALAAEMQADESDT